MLKLRQHRQFIWGCLVGLGTLALLIVIRDGIALARFAAGKNIRSPNPVLIEDSELGRVPNPESRYNNSLGFRGEEFPLEKPDGVTRIVALGDSTSFSTTFDTYPHILNERYPFCEYINASVISYDAPTIYARFERDVLPLDPDVITIFMGAFHIRQHRPAIALPLYEVALQQIYELAEQNQIEAVLMTIPTTSSTAVDAYPLLWGALSKTELAAAAAELNAVAVEDAPMVIDAAAEDWPDELWADVTHFNAEGHQALADLIDEAYLDAHCEG